MYRSFLFPSLRWRVLIVAGLFGCLGSLAGAVVGIFLQGVPICLIVGAIVGGIFGAALEAWPLSPGNGEKNPGAGD